MRASIPLPTIIALDVCGPVAGIAQGVPGKLVVMAVPVAQVSYAIGKGTRR